MSDLHPPPTSADGYGGGGADRMKRQARAREPPHARQPKRPSFLFFFLNDSNYLIAHWIVMFGESNDISFPRLFHEFSRVTFIPCTGRD